MIPDSARFVPQADGLRGIAALNVVLSHYFGRMVPEMLSTNYPGVYDPPQDGQVIFDILHFPLFNILYHGQFAVLVFFVLSGYVLALPAHAGNRESIERRFWGRYLRLTIPVFFAVLFTWALWRLGAYYPGEDIPGLNTYAALSVFERDFPFWMAIREGLWDAAVLGSPTMNIPLWSIGAEFVGSLLVLALFFPPGRRKWIILGAVLVFGAAVYTNDVMYLVAMLVGTQIPKVRPSRLGVVAFALAGVYFGGYQQDTVYYHFLPETVIGHGTKNIYGTIGAICLTVAVINGLGAPLFRSRAALFLGRISFPLYILHYPVLMSFGLYSYALLPQAAFTWGLHFLLFLAACLALATLFERILDQPAIALSKRFARAVLALRDRSPRGLRPARPRATAPPGRKTP